MCLHSLRERIRSCHRPVKDASVFMAYGDSVDLVASKAVRVCMNLSSGIELSLRWGHEDSSRRVMSENDGVEGIDWSRGR